MMRNHKGTKEGIKNETFCFFVTVQHPHLASPLPLSPPQRGGQGEETFFPRPWWEGNRRRGR